MSSGWEVDPIRPAYNLGHRLEASCSLRNRGEVSIAFAALTPPPEPPAPTMAWNYLCASARRKSRSETPLGLTVRASKPGSGEFLEEFLDAEKENGRAAHEKVRQRRSEPRIGAQEKPAPEQPGNERKQRKSQADMSMNG